jgi:hypothetical protein
MLIGFNAAIYQTIEMFQRIAVNPKNVLATNLGQLAERWKIPGSRAHLRQ